MSQITEEIKEKLDIVDVISAYIKVEKTGINYKAKCPFHNEKTPSFYISTQRQTFYCFGCQEKGDIFTFVEKFEGLDFKGALTTLADKAGVELKKFKGEEFSDRENKEKEKLYEILEEATKIFERNLSEFPKGKQYLKGRGLSEEGIKKWRIGYAKDEWRNLHDNLLNKGFSKSDLISVGLVKKVDGEEKYYDTFRDRIIFPIADTAGRIIAFSGRTLKFDDEKTPKYLNSPETKLFYKSEVLYGFHVAKNFIRKLDYAVLVEGQMDLVMSHEAGISNTLASSGTALTLLHLKKIQKLSNRIIIAYDSDVSGLKASRKAAALSLSLGMEIKIAILSDGEDPASVVKEDPEKWKKAIRESVHFIDFALEKAIKENANKDRDLTKEVLKNVLPLVSLIKSDIEKSQFIKKVAMRIRVPEEAVRNDLNKIQNIEIERELQEQDQNFDFKKGKKLINLERIMVGIIFLEGEREKWLKIFSEQKLNEIIESYENEKEVILFEAESYGKESYAEVLKRVELAELKKQLQKIAMILDDGSINEAEERQTRDEFEKIQKRIRELTI